jgi:hypothetical protein
MCVFVCVCVCVCVCVRARVLRRVAQEAAEANECVQGGKFFCETASSRVPNVLLMCARASECVYRAENSFERRRHRAAVAAPALH